MQSVPSTKMLMTLLLICIVMSKSIVSKKAKSSRHLNEYEDSHMEAQDLSIGYGQNTDFSEEDHLHDLASHNHHE